MAEPPSPRTLAWLNAAGPEDAARGLDGLYEHSPWIVEAAVRARPAAGWRSLAGFKHTLVRTVDEAPRAAQLALIRAHPELAGKAALAGELTAESTGEQARAGLDQCSPAEFAAVQSLNAAYNARFGWPFILAVRGPRGLGLPRQEILATLERRLAAQPAQELAECLRNIHRIAEIRLNDKFGVQPRLGEAAWDACEALAAYSDTPWAERGELTATYLSPAHRACAKALQAQMEAAGCDEVGLDAVGNVVGLWRGSQPGAPRLLSGSHYDTVRNAGKYDGRLGIVVPMVALAALRRQGRRLPFDVEVIGFAEEEGQRYRATFLGSGALVGAFDPAWLEQTDAEGVTMREAMQAAGLPGTLESIAALRRDPAHYMGFVEVHIEQGPVLHGLGLPLGVVRSINGSVRAVVELQGVASHAGTTPMGSRHDAAAAAAELLLALEQRAAAVPDLVGTVGQLEVPGGSVNVVPGRCRFTLDIRATTDAVRDACYDDTLATLAAVCERRGLGHRVTPSLRAPAAPCDPVWQARWAKAVEALGLPVHTLPSGAGHDAMKLHEALPQAMLFVRGQNGGISHNPLESTTADDMQLAVEVFLNLLEQLAPEETR